MKVQYHAPFSINQYLKNEVEQQLKKIDRLNFSFSEADAYFKLKDGNNSMEDKEFELKIHVTGQVLFAKSHANTFERAIPVAVEKVRRQLVKYKEGFVDRRKGR